MVVLPERPNRVAAAIFAAYVESAKDWRRPHLGASAIGEENCLRHLWYGFRWAQQPDRDGRLLRLFERGAREEGWLIDDLRLAGFTVHDRDESQPVDPATGKHPQLSCWLVDGHFGGSCDGLILGVPDAPKTWHLLELKTSNKDRFDKLVASSVRQVQPGHHAQMQTYMRGLKLKRALYVCVCKDNDRIYTERVHYDPGFAAALVDKAKHVIGAPEPLSRISEDPTWFECKFCDHRPICHLQQVARIERNCRTCVSATPHEGGTWTCNLHQRALSIEEQRTGCEQHVLIPSLLPWQPVDASETERWVLYQKPDGSRVADYRRTLHEDRP